MNIPVELRELSQLDKQRENLNLLSLNRHLEDLSKEGISNTRAIRLMLVLHKKKTVKQAMNDSGLSKVEVDHIIRRYTRFVSLSAGNIFDIKSIQLNDEIKKDSRKKRKIIIFPNMFIELTSEGHSQIRPLLELGKKTRVIPI